MNALERYYLDHYQYTDAQLQIDLEIQPCRGQYYEVTWTVLQREPGIGHTGGRVTFSTDYAAREFAANKWIDLLGKVTK